MRVGFIVLGAAWLLAGCAHVSTSEEIDESCRLVPDRIACVQQGEEDALAAEEENGTIRGALLEAVVRGVVEGIAQNGSEPPRSPPEGKPATTSRAKPVSNRAHPLEGR